jgi:predicted transcriptional regulator
MHNNKYIFYCIIFIIKNNWWLYLLVTGTLLKKLRLEAGLTQMRLSELVGVSQAHIAKIELGKVDARLSTINRILTVIMEGKKMNCKDIMTEGVLVAKPNNSILKVSEVMVKNAISQMPVLDGNRVAGTITEEDIISNLSASIAEEKVRNVMGSPLPMVSEETSVDTIRPMLERHQGVLITRGKELVGIITRSDLLKTIS